MGVDRTVAITARQREILLALLERHLPGTTAWIYGSRANGTARPQSDLDLVVFSTPAQRARVGDRVGALVDSGVVERLEDAVLREAFEESNLPFRVDLFVWDEVPDSFRRQIRADHVIVRESKSTTADPE